MPKLIPIFKSGLHKDSKGNTKNWTAKELDLIASKYNNQNPDNFHEAPIVIGHPKSNSPAWGWIKSIKRIGDVLCAEPKQLTNEFVEWVKNGLYKKRSISLYPDLTLRHVGFLGAMPPAVKGLPDIEFSEDADTIYIEFEETNDYFVSSVSSKFGALGDILRKIREYFIEKEGLEKADLLVPDWGIKSVQNQIEVNKNYSDVIDIDDINKTSLEDTNLNNEGDNVPDKNKNTNGNVNDFAEENKNLKAENEKLKNSLLAKEKEGKRQSFQSFCEENKKKITPAMKDKIIDFMEIIDGAGEYEFSEEKGKAKKNALDEFKSLIKGLPDQVDFSEITNKKKAGEQGQDGNNNTDTGYEEFGDVDVDEERAALDKKVKALMKKEKLTYKEALAQCQKGGE